MVLGGTLPSKYTQDFLCKGSTINKKTLDQCNLVCLPRMEDSESVHRPSPQSVRPPWERFNLRWEGTEKETIVSFFDRLTTKWTQ